VRGCSGTVRRVDAPDLYRLPPEEFTAARDSAAKAAKDEGDAEAAKELKALRKPSVAAWLVNLLVAEQPELVEQLLALGPALAQAQTAGQGDELRALGAQRRELVDAVVARAVELADRSTTAAVRDEVASTLETALADPEAADAVRSGRLVRALSYAGFGGVDLAGAVARTSSSPKAKAPRKADDRGERVAVAEAAALEAAGRLDDAVRACEQAQREREAAQRLADTARTQADELRSRLAEVEATATQAESQRRKAEKAAEAAVGTVRKRQAGEEQARAELDRLRRSD
jgi:hypothetical protein